MEHSGAIAYGKQFPEFWVHSKPFNGGNAETANGTHFSFSGNSKEEVQSFYDAAISNGGTDDGAPGPRPDYGEPYYGCFVRDPDGHKLEATFWDESLMAGL
ncbi:MAG: putative lactoylglutathione lyase [Candidatus Azotimanducaceae bacterium]|jgi:predicted lactoylglutathione lyase